MNYILNRAYLYYTLYRDDCESESGSETEREGVRVKVGWREGEYEGLREGGRDSVSGEGGRGRVRVREIVIKMFPIVFSFAVPFLGYPSIDKGSACLLGDMCIQLACSLS